MIETLFITALIVAISMLFLAANIILKKNGRFPNSHVCGNKAMRQRGIHSAQSQDAEAQVKSRLAIHERE